MIHNQVSEEIIIDLHMNGWKLVRNVTLTCDKQTSAWWEQSVSAPIPSRSGAAVIKSTNYHPLHCCRRRSKLLETSH